MIDPLELHAYADGQLDKADRDRVARQLETDAASKAELDSIVALKQFVSAKCEAVECKEEWRKCVGRLNELDKSKRAELECCEKVLKFLKEEKKDVRFGHWNYAEIDFLNQFQLLTAKVRRFLLCCAWIEGCLVVVVLLLTYLLCAVSIAPQ